MGSFQHPLWGATKTNKIKTYVYPQEAYTLTKEGATSTQKANDCPSVKNVLREVPMKCYRNSEEKILKSAASAQPSWRGGERPKKENRKLTAVRESASGRVRLESRAAEGRSRPDLQGVSFYDATGPNYQART